MLKLNYTNKFKKDYKLAKKRGYPIDELETVIEILQGEKPLDEKYQDHELNGNYRDFRECHIRPDWLLIYRVENNTLTLTLVRTGTHSDLF
jgi:mRNA interferase YafQ